MNLTPHTRRLLRLQHLFFILLLLAVAGLLGWLSNRYAFEADWTRDRRHSLSATSLAVLNKLDGPLSVTAYASPASNLREPIRDLVEKYQRVKADLALRFVDPIAAPGEAREKEIQSDGELLIEYQGRAEHLSDLDEESMSRALQRLLRKQQRWLVFAEGHGERNPLGQANHDYGYLGQHLKSRGFSLQPLSLAQMPLPADTAVLVLAGPRRDFLPAETEAITRYLEQGGNLLWLLDPGPWHGLEPLAALFGLSVAPGVLADPASAGLFGPGKQAMLLFQDYPAHPLTRRFPPKMQVLLPETLGLRLALPARWEKTALLPTAADVWAETGDLAAPTRDPGEESGPFEAGVLLTRISERQSPDSLTPRQHEQRVAILGDGDFLSNSYLANGGNLDLGLSLFDWLAEDDDLLAVPPRAVSDRALVLSSTASLLIAFGFLLVLPLGSLAVGLLIWRQRRRA